MKLLLVLMVVLLAGCDLNSHRNSVAERLEAMEEQQNMTIVRTPFNRAILRYVDDELNIVCYSINESISCLHKP